jgi:CDP-glucose 4,6-dehydratase
MHLGKYGVKMSDFWQDKNVFLTGHTGFKGSWLVLWLNSLGAKVHGYALAPPTQTNLYTVVNAEACLASNTIADIRDAVTLKQSMQQAQSDIVIHMAAQPLVRQSYLDPVETYSTNVMGTVNLLEAVRRTPSVKAVINITTDKCYENREWVWPYREDEAMGGYDPYSSSKGCSELVTAAYRRSFLAEAGVAVASARAGNVIGGGDWAVDRLIPDILRAIGEGCPVVIRNPHAIRPWQHVLEPLSGYLQLAQKLYEDGIDYAEGWNFGPNSDDAQPVQWIVEQLTQKWGDGANWQKDDAKHPHEAHYLKLDCSKAQARLGWRPQWTLAQALQHITTWHKAHHRGDDMQEFSLKQIADFQRIVKI